MGTGIGGGRLGTGLAFPIISLLVFFDFFNYVHVLFWLKQKLFFKNKKSAKEKKIPLRIVRLL